MEQVGELNHNCKTKETTVIEVCKLLTSVNRPPFTEIAEITGASYGVVKNIHNGETWTHISSKYGIKPYERSLNKF